MPILAEGLAAAWFVPVRDNPGPAKGQRARGAIVPSEPRSPPKAHRAWNRMRLAASKGRRRFPVIPATVDLRWTSRLGSKKPPQGGSCGKSCVVRLRMERAKGFEPSTPTLARLCSTPELHPRSVARQRRARRVICPKSARLARGTLAPSRGIPSRAARGASGSAGVTRAAADAALPSAGEPG